MQCNTLWTVTLKISSLINSSLTQSQQNIKVMTFKLVSMYSRAVVQQVLMYKCLCVQHFFLGQCVLPASLLPVYKCIVFLTTLSQMLQSPWGWFCWMRLPPPKETLARGEVSRDDCSHLFFFLLIVIFFPFFNSSASIMEHSEWNYCQECWLGIYVCVHACMSKLLQPPYNYQASDLSLQQLIRMHQNPCFKRALWWCRG